MDKVYLKNEFNQWLTKQLDNRRMAYTEKTKQEITNALSNACAEIENLDLQNKDLFSIDSPDVLQKITTEIRSHKDLQKVHQIYGETVLSEGLTKICGIFSVSKWGGYGCLVCWSGDQ